MTPKSSNTWLINFFMVHVLNTKYLNLLKRKRANSFDNLSTYSVPYQHKSCLLDNFRYDIPLTIDDRRSFVFDLKHGFKLNLRFVSPYNYIKNSTQ